MRTTDNLFEAWNLKIHTTTHDFWNKISKSCMKYMFSSFEENKFLINCLKKNQNLSVLDYGCASGYLKRFLGLYFNSNLKYTGVDLSIKSIELAKKNYGDGFFTDTDYFLSQKII